jgi:hypothetical protein
MGTISFPVSVYTAVQIFCSTYVGSHISLGSEKKQSNVFCFSSEKKQISSEKKQRNVFCMA